MPRRLPPLSTLPVLEAAARLGSYSLAAEELFVTHGAVSHQIKSLEASLGTRLFVRTGRGVALTAEGRAFAGEVRAGLQRIADAADAVRPSQREHRLAISVLPSFASRWLMPRLGRFLESHPQFQVSVEATQALTDFAADDIDVAIRYGVGPWPGLDSERLAGDSYLAVASPRFRRGRMPTTPAQVAKLPLFHGEPELWARWFRAAGVDFTPDAPPISYNDAAIHIQQVQAGEGVVVTRRSLVDAELRAGKLVRLFDIEFDSDKAYHFVCPPHKSQQRKVVEFRVWLQSEIDWTRR
jgi:LysR family glycine cleavage system transcriptional activator